MRILSQACVPADVWFKQRRWLHTCSGIFIVIRYGTVHMELLVKLVVTRDNYATVERLCALVFHTGRDAQTTT